MAPIIHIIAQHRHLWRKMWDFFRNMTIFEFQSCIDHLDKRHGITVSTILLITEWTCEIIVLNIPKVIFFRNESIWDVFWFFILFSPWLSILYSFMESISLLTKLLLPTLFSFQIDSLNRWKSLCQSLTVEVRSLSCFMTFKLWVHLTQFEIFFFCLHKMKVELTQPWNLIFINFAFVFLSPYASDWVFGQTSLFRGIWNPAWHRLVTNWDSVIWVFEVIKFHAVNIWFFRIINICEIFPKLIPESGDESETVL